MGGVVLDDVMRVAFNGIVNDDLMRQAIMKLIEHWRRTKKGKFDVDQLAEQYKVELPDHTSTEDLKQDRADRRSLGLPEG